MIFSAHSQRAAVTVEDVERLSGFAEHKKRNADFDREREAGFHEDTAAKAADEKALALAAKVQRAAPKEIRPGDNRILFKEDQAERKLVEQEQEKIRRQFVKDSRGLSKYPLVRSISEEEELDLVHQRPRFDYKKRTLYSSRGSIVPTAPSSGGNSRRLKDPSRSNIGNSSFPPPAPTGPSYDDFPPPPPMFGGEGGQQQEEFPPPPPAFDEFDSEFPPPPPPPPMDFPPPEN